MTDKVDAFLRKLDQAEKVRQFAETHLGCDGRQTDAFVRCCEEFFEWDGVRLLWRHNGENTVAVDDKRCKAFFEAEYPFLLPPKKPEPKINPLDHVKLDPALIEAALGGNLTARGQIARALNDDPAAADLFLKGEAKKRGTGGTKKSAPMNGDNPFTRLRDPATGKTDEAAAAEVATIIKTRGIAAAGALARQAGVTLNGTPLAGRFA